MRNRIKIALLLYLGCFNANCQKSNLIGKWHRPINHWIDESRIPELVISDSFNVKFQQHTFKNPCSYRFDGKIKNDTIFYKTTLHCLDRKEDTMKFIFENTEKHLIQEITDNHLTLIHLITKEKREYYKKNITANFHLLLTSNKWMGTPTSLQIYNSKTHPLPSKNTFSVLEFKPNKELIIDYGEAKETYIYTMINDTTIELNSKETKKYKDYYLIKSYVNPSYNIEFILKSKMRNQKDSIHFGHYDNTYNENYTKSYNLNTLNTTVTNNQTAQNTTNDNQNIEIQKLKDSILKMSNEKLIMNNQITQLNTIITNLASEISINKNTQTTVNNDFQTQILKLKDSIGKENMQIDVNEMQAKITQLNTLVQKLCSGGCKEFTSTLQDGYTLETDASKLYQNIPNPTSKDQSVKIPYYITFHVHEAEITIYNAMGQRIQSQIVSERAKAGAWEVNISGIASGMYPYSLKVDGKVIDTKIMIVTQ